MADSPETNKATQAILDKLHQKAAVTDDELKQLQQHIDILERAVAASHHHHDDSTKLE
jgi:hypothetical protein